MVVEAEIDEEPDALNLPVQDFHGVVARIEDLTPTIKGVWIELDAPITFQAGQYVNLHIPGEGNTRAFSIASAPAQRNEIELNIRRVPGGMGIPSTAIYVTELVRSYGVRRIIRVGTCGGVGEVAVGDVLLAQSGSTDSRFNRMQFGGHDLSTCADFGLLRAAVDAAGAQGIQARLAHVFSTDCFYDGDPQLLAHLRRHRIHGVEMETAGLYGLAMREGFAALAILAVSDHLDNGASMPPEEREQGLARVARLALACTDA